MSKRKWRIINNRPYRLLITLVGVASLMGVSYASLSDQLSLQASVNIQLPSLRGSSSIDEKLTGNIVIGEGNVIEAGGTGCIHEDLYGKGECIDQNRCPYYINRKGITIREPIYIPYDIQGGIIGVTGQAIIELSQSNTSNTQLVQVDLGNINVETDIHVLKDNNIYLPVDAHNLSNRTLEKGHLYVIEISIKNLNMPLGDHAESLADIFSDFEVDSNGLIKDISAEVDIAYNLQFADGSHLCNQGGGKKIHKQEMCEGQVRRNDILDVVIGKYRDYFQKKEYGPASSGIYIAPPGVSFLPEFPVPPDINGTEIPDINLPTTMPPSDSGIGSPGIDVPTFLPEVPVPPDMDATEIPDINLPTTMPDATESSDLHTPSILPEVPMLPEGNGTETPKEETSETTKEPVPPISSTETTLEVPQIPEENASETPDIDVPTTIPEVVETPESSSSETLDMDMPTTMPDITSPISQGDESSIEAPQEDLISD